MAYKVHIANEGNEGIAGTLFFYDADGLRLGEFAIPVEGAEVPADWVNAAASFQVDSPGYIGYAVTQLGEFNNFILVRDNASKVIIVVLILAGVLVAKNFLKL